MLKTREIGITDTADQWLQSYLGNRQQCVTIKGELSQPVSLTKGMPQRPILGPKGYPPYVSQVFHIARQHGVCIHIYANDTQLYVDFDVSQWEETKLRMQHCIKGCIMAKYKLFGIKQWKNQGACGWPVLSLDKICIHSP